MVDKPTVKKGLRLAKSSVPGQARLDTFLHLLTVQSQLWSWAVAGPTVGFSAVVVHGVSSKPVAVSESSVASSDRDSGRAGGTV